MIISFLRRFLCSSLFFSCFLQAQDLQDLPLFPDEAIALQLLDVAPTEAALEALSEILMIHALRMDATAREANDPNIAIDMQQMSLEYAWRAVKADPGNLAGLRFLGGKLPSFSETNIALAIDLLSRAQQIEYDEKLALLLTGLLARNGHYIEVVNELEPLLATQTYRASISEDEEVAAVVLLGNAYLISGQLDRGKDFFSNRVSEEPARPDDWSALARIMAALDETDQAIAQLDASIADMSEGDPAIARLDEIRLGLRADQILVDWRRSMEDTQ